MTYPMLLHLTGQAVVEVTRTVGGSFVKGVWQKGTPTTLHIKANVQPLLKGADLLILPEGDRTKELIKVYTTSPLLQRKEGSTPNEGDLIAWDGKVYEVLKVIAYKMGLLDHYKAICVRKELT